MSDRPHAAGDPPLQGSEAFLVGWESAALGGQIKTQSTCPLFTCCDYPIWFCTSRKGQVNSGSSEEVPLTVIYSAGPMDVFGKHFLSFKLQQPGGQTDVASCSYPQTS